tara:strand:- start:191 stop:310 length:120 start_codon:yes stop_codon:yes gene_type:complete
VELTAGRERKKVTLLPVHLTAMHHCEPKEKNSHIGGLDA